jgi:hypothetical protein
MRAPRAREPVFPDGSALLRLLQSRPLKKKKKKRENEMKKKKPEMKKTKSTGTLLRLLLPVRLQQ